MQADLNAMSNVNIRRAIDNIRSTTNVYTPIIETIVNAIQAIDETGNNNGMVLIRVQRSKQVYINDSLPEIVGFEIEDNGIGFTDIHRNSFDTLYTDNKINVGGKGFGRFTCLKYFEDLHIKSVYRDCNGFKIRRFSMGKEHDIIVNEMVNDSGESITGSTVTLSNLNNNRKFDKKLLTIAQNIIERLLPYFITEDYDCPEIIVSEDNSSSQIRLNSFFNNEISSAIHEIKTNHKSFTLKAGEVDEEFHVRIFKFFSPRNMKSRISLVANKREVSGSKIGDYIPEFEDEFYEKSFSETGKNGRNYIIKLYVFSTYLDSNVSLERGGFEFGFESDILFGISQKEIEYNAAIIAQEVMGQDVNFRKQKKRERVQKYIDESAPWHRHLLSDIVLIKLPCNASNSDIENYLQKEKIAQEIAVRRDVSDLLTKNNLETIQDSVAEIVNKLSDTSKNDLIHYVALRLNILEIFGKSLEKNESGKYKSEGVIHDIIFPRKGNLDKTPFHEHNLWLVDERLNFTNWLSSDLALDQDSKGRPDILAYGRRVLFRGDNDPSNPITIFEFKRPGRDDFVNSNEDPVEQIIRYANQIRSGKAVTPKGRPIHVSQNTPFYGYIVCDLTNKVSSWLHDQKNFNSMPDGMGWFLWMDNINLYIEVISWDKIYKDAKMRNQIYFNKIGLDL